MHHHFIRILPIALLFSACTTAERNPSSALAQVTKEEIITLGNPGTPYESQVAKALRVLSSSRREHQIDPQAVRDAFAYYQSHANLFSQPSFLVIDLSTRDTIPRGILVSLKDAVAYHLRFAHGKGSDRDNDGFANEFHIASEEWKVKNAQSPLGFFRVGNLGNYKGGEPDALYLKGLEKGINNDIEPTSAQSNFKILIHSKYYADVDNRGGDMGRSWGCFVVSPKWGPIVQKAAAGGLLYSFHPQVYKYR